MTSEGKRHGHGKAQAAALAAIRAAGSTGIAFHDLAEAIGTSYLAVVQVVALLRADKLVQRAGGTGKAPGLLFAVEFAPPPTVPAAERKKQRAAQIAKITKDIGRKPGMNAAESDAIVPPTVKRTVGPSNLDLRYTVARLPDGYVSELDPAECREWAKAAV